MLDDLSDRAFIACAPFREIEPGQYLPGTDGLTVLDYWRWAYANVLENVQRGIFAEFLVASALATTTSPRVAWNGFDIDYNGFKIEVKSSAFLQAWNQKALSKPSFSIGARRQLDEDGISYETKARYVADCYIFCLFTDNDGPSADVLDVGRWLFYVVPTARLLEACGAGKSLSLGRLQNIASSVSYKDLKRKVSELKGS